jgi:integrase
MVTLAQDHKGNYKARKRIPDDVREDYGRLYGLRAEVKFYKAASTKPDVARQLFNKWSAQVEGRITAIRAQHKGEGVSLTQEQTHALAGEWYDWFLARHPEGDLKKWEDLRDHVHDALREAVGEVEWERNDPSDLWRDDEELRRTIRPVMADVGETAQFLAMKGMVLDGKTQGRFLNYLYDDLAAAFKRLIGIAEGDYSPDEYRKRFPKFEGADTGETPQQLFERWVSERNPQPGTIETWGYVFSRLSQYFEGRSAASIKPEEAQQWLRSLITKERQARTVRNTDLRASKTIFNWAVEHKCIPRNPFEKSKVTVPRKIQLRESKAFEPQEWQPILKAALAITDTRKPFDAAKRWVPWLLAYTGARPGEITQLRKGDVIDRNGIHALNLTPDAGSIKSGKARTAPLHEHLVAQGFLKFVESHRDGPLFYRPDESPKKDDPIKVKKSRAAQVRQRLATWVGSLGVKGKELSPNHGWRHTFKQIAERAGISGRMSDSITGHAHQSVGASYGEPTLEDKAEAMKRFPRYKIE